MTSERGNPKPGRDCNPRVSIIMAVYNGERHLRECMDSILGQSFEDFEFIIVDDGSTDETSTILNGYDDPRIVRIVNTINVGLTRSLNRALKECRGQFIARQDADDIAIECRLETQLKYLEQNPHVGVLGSQMDMIDTSGRVTGRYELPLSNSLIAWRLFFGRSMAHPTVMMRKAIIENAGGYDPSLECAQDVELWARLVLGTQLENLPQSLYRYRERLDSISRTRSEAQLSASMTARQRLAGKLLGRQTPLIVLKQLHESQQGGYQPDAERARQCVGLILDLFRAMTERGIIAGDGSEETRQDMLGRILAATGRSEIALSSGGQTSSDSDRTLKIVSLAQKAAANPRKAYYVVRQMLGRRPAVLEPGKRFFCGQAASASPSDGITLIVLSFERMASLTKLLRGILSQELRGIPLEVIICNNSSRMTLKSSRFSTLGRLLRRFSNLKIFNSSYNWRCQIRYGIATIAQYDTVMFVDDDITLIDRDFIRYMFETFHTLRPLDILSCWNTLWVGIDDDALQFVSLNFNTPEITEITQTDTIGCGICMFNKKIVLSERIQNMFRDTGRADDMAFPIVANLEWGSRSFYLPSNGMLEMHDQHAGIAALNAVPGHYTDLYAKYKDLLDEGYRPVIAGTSCQCIDADSPPIRAARRLTVRSYPWNQS